MKIHELKTTTEHYRDLDLKLKTFEVRKNDRGFKKLDVLHLREWCSQLEKYTGRSMLVKVSHILSGGQYGIDPEYVVMSIQRLSTKF